MWIAGGAEDAAELEKLKKVMQESSSIAAKDSGGDTVIDWPRQRASLDERQIYGPFAEAFPALLPRGSGDVASAELRVGSKSGVSSCFGAGAFDSPRIPAFGSNSSTGSTGKGPRNLAPPSARRTATEPRPPRT